MFKRKGLQQTEAEKTKQTQFRKLCQLCSPNFTKEEILSTDIDWPVVWKLALRHRVVPIMVDRIKQLDVAVPDDIAVLMSANAQQNLYKGMKQAAELVRLTQLFEKHDIPFVVFKGIALLKLMGLELHQRHHGDIDLLLADVEDVWRADIALRSIGYQRRTLPKSFSLNAPQKRYFKRYEKDVIYDHPQRSIHLELHFKVCLSEKLLPISPQEFYKNRSMIEVSSISIPVMSRADHQIYLLAHGAVSRWFRLKWLCDVPLASNNGEAYLSTVFSDRVSALDIDRMATLGKTLANTLLAMPITSKTLKHKNSSKSIQCNIRLTETHMTQQEYNHMKIFDKIYFWFTFDLLYMPSLKKDVSYKIDHFRSYLTRISDWELLPLPASLFFLYYPLRPLLWLKRQL